ncbi:hypothetical protein NOF04DRAFT_1337737 [Fusarium oxysporum II5]|uniref:Uncharacterized protein n=2 Tax=Fusarium oxysporum species complex TaxID=171631 RepID=N1RQP5_FUSC4|nr:hypothetical protein FOC4_g10000049 [Fusarium odoratissimum]KAK2122252.1 hypothetical protein NOF04DRAFT_1337737 [Fusarium oxysporum II5]TXB97921.1 hypothetical protein FocTR4_00017034 [Fusarium oxysporum f. sp. cubense]
MTGLATYTDAIVTLRPSQLQKLESLGLYYNSPEPAIICIECGFAINPTRAPTSLLSVPLSVKVETPVVCGSTSYGIGGGGSDMASTMADYLFECDKPPTRSQQG